MKTTHSSLFDCAVRLGDSPIEKQNAWVRGVAFGNVTIEEVPDGYWVTSRGGVLHAHRFKKRHMVKRKAESLNKVIHAVALKALGALREEGSLSRIFPSVPLEASTQDGACPDFQFIR